MAHVGIRQGIRQGIWQGIRQGVSQGYGARLLYDLDFSTPVTAFDFSHTNATEEWLMQEASSTYTNAKGGTALTVSNGMMGQTAVGLYNGTDYVSRKCWEVRPEAGSGTDHLEADASTLDSDNEDLCFCIVFRSTNTNGTGVLAGKRDASPYNGWMLGSAGSGYMTASVDDGAGSGTAQVNANHYDGAWHWAKLWWDHSTKQLSLKSDLGDDLAVSTTITGSITSTTEFQVGRAEFWSSTASPNLQIVYMGGCTGANSEAMFDETVTLPGTDPTGVLTTQSRNSTISHWVGSANVSHFGPDTAPIVDDPALTSGYGLLTNKATTNLLPESEDFTAWTNSNSTDTMGASAVDSPDGFHRGTELTATAASGYIHDSATVTAETDYTFSCWIKRKGGSDVESFLQIYDTVNTASVINTGFTATDTWQRFEVTGQTAAGGTTMRCDIGIDTDTEEIYIWGAQLELGDGASHYVRTVGASAATVASDFIAPFEISLGDIGEIEATWVRHNFPGTGGWIYSAEPASGSDNEKSHYTDSSTRVRTRIWDGAGASEDISFQNILANATEYVVRHVWDVNGDLLSGEQAMVVNGTTYESGTAPWDGTSPSAGDAVTQIKIGNLNSANELNGVIQRIRSFSINNGDLP